ncbi:MAG: UDP-N-acetylglucosamine 2-epimerase (non-hydrolyzing) [Nitrososphaeria archaeon]
MHILIIIGTRPEITKVAPVVFELERKGIPYNIVWTGQHYDYEMSKVFFEEINLPEPNVYLNLGGDIEVLDKVAFMIRSIRDVIRRIKPIAVYSLGDTATTLASALASVYEELPFIHDEAGMRSFDMFMVEEVNRKVADVLASVHFAPTKLAYYNLLREGASKDMVYLTGSTAVDMLISTMPLIKQKSLEIYYNRDYILVTIHRRENILHLPRLRIIVNFIKKLAEKYTIVFPIHPHTRKKLQEYGLLSMLNEDKIVLSRPMSYIQFMSTMYNSKSVITDSGGVQEEAFIFGKPTITLRKTTEWPETIILGYNTLIDPDILKDSLEGYVQKILNHIEKSTFPPDLVTCPIGDGHASSRIAKTLKLFAEGVIKIKQINVKIDLTNLYYMSVLKNRGFIYFNKETGLPTPKDSICVERGRSGLSQEKLVEFIKVDWETNSESNFSYGLNA